MYYFTVTCVSISGRGGGVCRGSVMQAEKGQVAGTCGYGEDLSSSINAGNFLTGCRVYRLASQEGLCSMEYVTCVSPCNC
jgi:hypothetical protein